MFHQKPMHTGDDLFLSEPEKSCRCILLAPAYGNVAASAEHKQIQETASLLYALLEGSGLEDWRYPEVRRFCIFTW